MTALLSLRSIGLVELEIMAFVISVPIPVPIPMPRFTNGRLYNNIVITMTRLDAKTSRVRKRSNQLKFDTQMSNE